MRCIELFLAQCVVYDENRCILSYSYQMDLSLYWYPCLLLLPLASHFELRHPLVYMLQDLLNKSNKLKNKTKQNKARINIGSCCNTGRTLVFSPNSNVCY